MNRDKNSKPDPDEREEHEGQRKTEEELDEEIEQTFPASDPPSYSSPGNDKAEEKQDKT